MNYNKATICGRITKEVEVKAMPSGQSVASFTVATNHTYKDSNNEKKENVEFHNVVVFGKTAENSGKYLAKGQEVLVEGRIQTRSWEQDGVKKYRTEIIADNVQFGAPAKEKEKVEESPMAGKAPKAKLEPIEYPTETIDPNDIPF